MDNYNSNFLKALLSIPKKNLEQRIKELETEIKERLTIKEMIISNLQCKRIMLTGRFNTLGYLGYSFSSKRLLIEDKILKINGMIQQELVNSFRDNSILKDKLRQAKERLSKEREKLKLIK